MKRQQAFVAAMANKVISKGMLARPDRLIRFLKAETQSLTREKKLDSVNKIEDLGDQFTDIGLGKIKYITVQSEPYQLEPNQVIWSGDEEETGETNRNNKR